MASLITVRDCIKWYELSSSIFVVRNSIGQGPIEIDINIVESNGTLLYKFRRIFQPDEAQTYNRLYLNSLDSIGGIGIGNWIPRGNQRIEIFARLINSSRISSEGSITIPLNGTNVLTGTVSSLNLQYRFNELIPWSIQYSKLDNGVDNNIRVRVNINRIYEGGSTTHWRTVYNENFDISDINIRTLNGTINISEESLTIGDNYRLLYILDYDSCNTLNRTSTEIESTTFNIIPNEEVITAILSDISNVGSNDSFTVHIEASALIDNQINISLDLVNVGNNTRTTVLNLNNENSPYSNDLSQTISTAGQYRYELTVSSNDDTSISKTIIGNNFNVESREVIVTFGSKEPSYDIAIINSISIPVTLQNNSSQNAGYRIAYISPNGDVGIITSGTVLANTTVVINNTTFFPNIIGRWVLTPLIDFTQFQGLELNVINTSVEEFIKVDPDPVESRGNLPGITTIVEEIPNNSYAISFSPELKGWDSVHRTIPQRYISRNLMVFDNGNIATIGRRASFQHSIIEKVIRFDYYSIIETVRILNENNNPSFITIKSYKFSTDRIEYSTFENYGEKIIINQIRSKTIINNNIVARGEYEQNFNNSYNNIVGTEFEDKFIEGEYCIIRLEYFSPFKLFDINVQSRKQDI